MSAALAHPEDIEQLARLEFGQRLGADHAAIGDDADLADGEAPAQPVDHRDQARHVGRVARPHLRAHRPSVAVDQHRQDHLAQVRTVILAEAVLSQRLPAGALEVQARRIHEHQVEAREQVAPVREQPFLHHILEAARRERRAAVLLCGRQFLAQPRHRPIEVMQIEPVDAGDPVVLAPTVRCPIGAAAEQPVQHGQEQRPLQRKAVLACARKFRDHRPAAGLLPQPLEHQRRPDAARCNLRGRVVGDRPQHHRLLGKPRARAQQPFQLAAGAQILVTPECRDHLLANLIAFAPALDDLQIGAPARSLAAEVHRRLRGAYRVAKWPAKINDETPKTWHYISRPRTPKIQVLCGFLSRVFGGSVEDGSDASRRR